ncbi:MAG: YihY/virulence factor BrkB family protein, partial [Verrucomicrobiota bacterium]|nr:YihY/virulence factor BrkB family protein [Verrucomicrobiota bacterium]
TLLLWIYYSSQILLFGAEFTQVYANSCGSGGQPSAHAVCIATFEKEISAAGEKPSPEVKAQVKAEADAAKAAET